MRSVPKSSQSPRDRIIWILTNSGERMQQMGMVNPVVRVVGHDREIDDTGVTVKEA